MKRIQDHYTKDPNGNTSLHQLSALTWTGDNFPFNQLAGKVVLIVNGASQTRYAGQYAGLQQLYLKFRDQGFEILLFPCNQFGSEPDRGATQAQDFAQTKFGVTFPIMEKVDVNGDLVHPVYDFLKSQQSQLCLTRVKWDFEKFLVNKKGLCVDRFSCLTEPADIAPKIAVLLGEP